MTDINDYLHVTHRGLDPVVGVSTINELRDDVELGYQDNSGHPVSVRTADDIEVRRVRSNSGHDVLYETSGQWPSNTQTLNLSQSVGEQLNGIIVEWSGYDPATSKAINGDWNYTHIPKEAVGRNGVRCPLYAGNTAIQKWLVVNDSSVTGVAANSSAPKNLLVLRRILGY